MLRDNSVWAKALSAPQTRVITSELESFTSDGLVTGDGETWLRPVSQRGARPRDASVNLGASARDAAREAAVHSAIIAS